MLCSVDLQEGCEDAINRDRGGDEGGEGAGEAEGGHHFEGKNDEGGTENSKGGNPGRFQDTFSSHRCLGNVCDTGITEDGECEAYQGGKDESEEAEEEMGDGWNEEGEGETEEGENDAVDYAECDTEGVEDGALGSGCAVRLLSVH